MRAPQAQTRGSTSKIFLSRRAHVLRASLEKSALSCSGCVFAAEPALSPSADEMAALARGAGPVPFLGKVSRTGAELPALQPGGLVVHSGRQDVRQVEPGLETGKLFPGLTKQRVRPGLSPEECVAAVHLLLLNETDSAQ